VSRHHIIPPAIYAPPPKPKETRRKRRIGYASAAERTGETEETGETSETRAAAASPQRPVEATERRIPSPNGKLSDDTLKAMIEMQEKEDGEDNDPSAG
jgi:hypothetical protein